MREEIIERVWSEEQASGVSDQAVDSLVHRTRERLRLAGGLFRPDGTRIGVRYDEQFSIETGEARIHVTGRDYEYTMTGDIDGLVTVKEPPAER